MNGHWTRLGELDWNKLSWATAGSGTLFGARVGRSFHGNDGAITRKAWHGLGSLFSGVSCLLAS